MLMDLPLYERWTLLLRVLRAVPQYRVRPSLPGIPEKQAQLKATLPIIYTQYQLTTPLD